MLDPNVFCVFLKDFIELIRGINEEKTMIYLLKEYLLKLFGGRDKATGVSISEIVEIGHLILLSIIKEFDVK